MVHNPYYLLVNSREIKPNPLNPPCNPVSKRQNLWRRIACFCQVSFLHTAGGRTAATAVDVQAWRWLWDLPVHDNPQECVCAYAIYAYISTWIHVYSNIRVCRYTFDIWTYVWMIEMKHMCTYTDKYCVHYMFVDASALLVSVWGTVQDSILPSKEVFQSTRLR